MAVSRSIRRARGLVRFLNHYFPDYVEGGCYDVSEIIADDLQQRGHDVALRWGWATTSQGCFAHVWMNVDGKDFDPVLWVRGRRASYKIDPKAKDCFEHRSADGRQAFLAQARKLIAEHYWE